MNMTIRNENRPGYKETKVGWIPSDWNINKIEKIVDNARPICYGIVQTGSDINATIPCVRVQDLTASEIDITQLLKTTPEIHRSYKRTILRKGDLMFALRGEIGLTRIVSSSLENANLTRGLALISKSDNTNSEFLSYIISSFNVRKRILVFANGSALKEIPIGSLKKLPIPLPPLPEQKKIAQILSAWDKAIEQTRKLIDAKKELKKGLMQQLLSGRMRFPQFGKPAAKGEIPEGWREVKLGKCFRERNETNPDLQLLSITTAKGVILRDEVDRKDTSNVDKSKYKVIKVGDIGYNTMRMWQGVSAVSKFEGIVSPAYTICTPINGNSPEYFGYLFKYLPMIHLFYRYSQGLVSDTWNLKYHHFSIIKAIVPGPEEQEKIASCFMKIDDEIAVLDEKMNALIHQKKGMMQKLLTGEIRVNHLIQN